MHFDPIFEPVAIASSSAAYVSSAASSSGAIPARAANPDCKNVGKGGVRDTSSREQPLRLEAAQVLAAYYSLVLAPAVAPFPLLAAAT
eukprot:1483190-Pleurochrysis_carterae.AAC.1